MIFPEVWVTAEAVYHLDPATYVERIQVFKPYFFAEV